MHPQPRTVARLLAAIACAAALWIGVPLGAQVIDNDPAPRLMEPTELPEGPLLERTQRNYQGPRSRMVAPGRRGIGSFDSDYQGSAAPNATPPEGTWILSNGQYVPYDPGHLPGDDYAPPEHPSPLTCCDQDCDASYCSIWSWLHDRYEDTGCYCPCFWRNFSQFGGAQAFKGPADLGVNGNFGFHTGVNWATPLEQQLGVGLQLGTIFAVSDFEGGGGLVNDRRRYQYFVTGGLFRRAKCNYGLQGGAAVDYLHDDFYVHMNLMQVRGEVSYVWECGKELGLWSAVHVLDDNQTAPLFLGVPSITWQTTDQFNGFYRRRFTNGSTARCWIGLTDHADVLFGSDVNAILAERWSLQAGYNYLWPRSDSSIPASVRESWGLMISLTWYPGCKMRNACFNPYQPLFKVADNNSMMITTQ
jgi:hypothetical protein